MRLLYGILLWAGIIPLAAAVLLSVVLETVFAIGVLTDPGMRAVAALEAQDVHGSRFAR